MSKPITGFDLFAGLFGAEQSAKAKEEYQRALEKAAREVATWDEADNQGKKRVEMLDQFKTRGLHIRIFCEGA